MWKQNFFLTVLIASIYLINVTQSDELPPGIQKCRPGDGPCLPSIYTQLIQNSEEYPELNIPNLNPYRPNKTWYIQERSTSLLDLLSFNGAGSNIRLYGIKNARVEQIKGFRPDIPFNSDIFVSISIPCLLFHSYFKANFKLLSLIDAFPANGDLTAILQCIKIYVHMKGETVERNGERHLRVYDMNCAADVLCNFHVDFEFDTPIPITRNVVNGLINSNWRSFKTKIEPDISKYTCEMIHTILDPILEKVPIKDFFIKPNPY